MQSCLFVCVSLKYFYLTEKIEYLRNYLSDWAVILHVHSSDASTRIGGGGGPRHI